ncbi:MAG: hypothetical protein JSV94_04675 [Methanobacteriota archaeon]|nr:MAG: hypothetical protein JSV94_04675 [Euryarchaeota archaeon]
MNREVADAPDEPPLETATREDRALQESLNGGRGISVGAIGRPATIVFKSDVESTSVYVDEQWNVSVSRGALPNPNIMVEGDHDVLCSILQTKTPELASPGKLRITITKGSIKDFVMEIEKGEEIVHPLRELYTHGF